MAHRFQFFRAGGVDQVSLVDGSDMLALAELDQKLWVALAMPTKGVAIDPETLTMLDPDGDGRIRAPDVLAAIAWIKATFKKPNDVLTSKDKIELSAIADEKIVAAAKRMLSDLGKKAETSINVADTVAITKAFAETVLNGDGIVVPASTEDTELVKVIVDAIAAVGSVVDRSGKPGIDKALADAFFKDVDARSAWIAKGGGDALSPLGPKTADAAAATVAVRAKLEDYFTRCRIAAYDTRGADALQGQPPDLIALADHALSAADEMLAHLPLAKIDPRGRLPLGAAINPAWAARIDALVAHAIVPVLGARDHLTAEELATVIGKLEPFQTWMDTKPATKVDAFDAAWIEKLATSDLRQKLDELIAADTALSEDYAQIASVTKAVRLQRDFGRLLRNFVNFSDFYTKQDGIFQTGTLYLDAREFHLCVPVSDPAKHAALAASADACLIYCDLSRKGETRQIAAALTNGDADNVFPGRNGLFYDRDGVDWDATITKIINNPVSVRAAFWSPYKKLVKTIEDGVQKRAAAADAAAQAKMDAAGNKVAVADKSAVAEASAPIATPGSPAAAAAATAAEPAAGGGKIDLGTVAAIGVAIGGIGTLVGALLATLFGLGPWLPIGILAMLLMISGPAMLLAWLKLRRRNLGPILDANGWAINGRAKINVPFGAAMTELPKLPEGSKRLMDDPFAEKKTPWKRWVFLVVILGLGGLWYLGKLDGYLPGSISSVSVLGENAPAWKAAHPPVETPKPADAAKPADPAKK